MRRNLAQFGGKRQLSFRFKIRFFLWFYLCALIFESKFSNIKFKIALLNLFGGDVGDKVVLKSGIKIHFPWNLSIGDNSWIGEHVWFINHEKVKIGSNVCISQSAILCSGGHDYRSATLEYSHKPIEIKDGAWICLDSKVLPGVTIGECSVVAAGEIARMSVPDYSMLIAGEIRPIDPPK